MRISDWSSDVCSSDLDEHTAVARLVDDFLDPDEHGAFVIVQKEAFDLGQRFCCGVPALVGAIAQRVGMKSGSASAPCARQFARCDELAPFFDCLIPHAAVMSHHTVIASVNLHIKM